jgi:hypothetical protein
MTLIEAAIAILILSIGVVAVTALFATGLKYMSSSEYTLIARTKAEEAMESVFAARDDQTITWAQIHNVKGQTGSDGGIFLDGPLPINDPGPDGLVGTQDDYVSVNGSVPTPEYIVLPGPDGVYGTNDDVQVPLTRLSREILIRDVNPAILVNGQPIPLRTLTVIIRDNSTANPASGFPGIVLYQIQTYISPYT